MKSSLKWSFNFVTLSSLIFLFAFKIDFLSTEDTFWLPPIWYFASFYIILVILFHSSEVMHFLGKFCHVHALSPIFLRSHVLHTLFNTHISSSCATLIIQITNFNIFSHITFYFLFHFVARSECSSLGRFESWLASHGSRQRRTLERHSQPALLYRISGAFLSGRLSQSCWHCSPYDATRGKFWNDLSQSYFLSYSSSFSFFTHSFSVLLLITISSSPHHRSSSFRLPTLFISFIWFLSNDLILYNLTLRQVALRIIAKPSSKEYGIPSVVFQLYGAPTLNFLIPPSVFYPKPKVDSALLTLGDELDCHLVFGCFSNHFSCWC